ncbi:hypothetical protein GCM10028867_02020 [Nocardioides pacificus]
MLHRRQTRQPLVPLPELEAAFVEALQLLGAGPSQPVGDYVEFGVCRGDSMVCMANASRAVGVEQMRLVGFDSFEGLPDEVAEEDNGVWQPGQFRFSERAARQNLRRSGVAMGRVELVKGWFDQTATPELAARTGLEQVAVAMIDCDAYSSARTALQFLAPLLADRAVLFFDDWHSNGLAETGQGERRAFEELMSASPELSEVARLETYAAAAEVVLVERR